MINDTFLIKWEWKEKRQEKLIYRNNIFFFLSNLNFFFSLRSLSLIPNIGQTNLLELSDKF